MNESGWLVVMTKPRMETEAKKHLIRQGFEGYLPMWLERKRRPSGWLKVQSAMFPRYLFVRPSNSEQSISPIRSTRGISQLVRFGMEPAWASEVLIENIRAVEAARNNSRNELKPFKKGDQVMLLDGPFKGAPAEVLSSGQHRVILLLQVLGQAQQLEFEAGICQKRDSL